LDIRVKISLAADGVKKGASEAIGAIKHLTGTAQADTKKLNAYVEKSFNDQTNAYTKAKSRDMKALSDFEKKAMSSNRRMAKEAMRAQYGATGNAPTARAVTPRAVTPMARVEQANYKAEPTLGRQMALRTSEVKKQVAELKKQANDLAVSFKNKSSLLVSAKWDQAAASYTRKKWDTFYNNMAHQRDLTLRINSGDFEASMGRARYALYDLGRQAMGVGLGIAAGFGYAINAAAKFESAFTSVERTSGVAGAAAENLKNQLMDIATTSPISYEEITKIATLGAQLGIASSALTGFTNTVVAFSGITGIAVEEVSTSFGRLSQMLDVPVAQFENLSSSIAYVGVNAVATDKEILTMSESIAATASQAGYATDEVIGMAGALASLKVRPEEARGVLLRMFRTISTGVNEAGPLLNDMASVLGTNADAAAKMWKQDPSGYFQKLIEGASATGQLDQVMSSLGVTNTRELNVVQRLAGNMDVLNESMANAREQYALGTYSADAYSKVQDDLMTKFAVFKSSVDQLAAAFGDTFLGPLKGVMDFVNGLIEGIAKMPDGFKWMISIVAAAGAGFLIFKGATMLAIAGLIAAKIALNSFGETSIRSLASFGTVNVLLKDMGVSGGVATAGLNMLSGGLTGAKANMIGFGTAVKGAAAAMSGFQKALGIIGVVASILSVVVPLIIEASEANSKLGKSMLESAGGAEAVADAIRKDTAAAKEGATVYGTLTAKVSEATKADQAKTDAAVKAMDAHNAVTDSFGEAGKGADNYSTAANGAAAANDSLAASTAAANTQIENQTLALGENYAILAAQALTKYGSNADKNFWAEYADPANSKNVAALESAGFSAGEMITASMTDGMTATGYLDKFQGMIGKMNSIGAVKGGGIQKVGKEFGLTAEQMDKLTVAAEANRGMIPRAYGQFDEAAKSLDAMKASTKQAAAEQDLMKKALVETGVSEDAADNAVSGLNEQLKKNLEAVLAVSKANGTLENSMAGLRDTVQQTGGEFTTFTKEGRQELDAWATYMENSLSQAEAAGTGLAGGIQSMVDGLHEIELAGGDAAVPFQQMRDYLQNAVSDSGYTDLNISTAKNTEELRKQVEEWTNNKIATEGSTSAAAAYGKQLLASLQPASNFAQQFLRGWVDDQSAVTDEVNGTKEALVTLGDYASNVASVIADALNFRFGRNNGLSEMRTAIQEFNDRTDDARKKVRDLRDEIAGKKNDKADLQAQLDLAIKYGDAAGAEDIRKQIATLNEDIAASQEDLAYQNGIATGSMDLNTQAGRDNYAAAQDIIQANADYVQSLIESGASQDTVNKAVADGEAAFRSQMRAMGVAPSKIDDLAAAFDDMNKIIDEVPNEVNVDANTDPATRALHEFITKANDSKATVTLDVKPPTKADRLKALRDERKRIQDTLDKQKGLRGLEGVNAQLQLQVDSINALIASGNYASGGLIRGRGTPTSDSIPINASNGEFIMQASAVRAYGTDFMNAINQQKFGGAMPVSAKIAAGGNGPQMVYLSQEDRKLLRAAVDRPVVLYSNNKTIAESANAGNKELARRGKN
jgi:TP901 family phage tail tape measure protein